MIKASELRLNNLVYSWENDRKGLPTPVTATLITYLSTLHSTQEYISVKRIPLTSEILEKVGFYRTVYEENDAFRLDLYTSVGNHLSMIYFPGSDANGVMLFNNGTPVGDMLYEYLHQLQNLYHSLTGKELEINL